MRELADFDSQRMHMQMVGRADFKDVVAHREFLRRRKINTTLWIITAVSLLIGISFWSIGIVKYALFFWIVAGVMLISLAVRYGLFGKYKRYKRNGKHGGWEQIDRLPDWAYKKMKKKRTSKVNGDHYVYKKENGHFYRKLK